MKGRYNEEDINIFEILIDELGEYLNKYNPLVKKFKHARCKLNDMDKKKTKNEYYMYFSVNGWPKGAYKRQYNLSVVTEMGITLTTNIQIWYITMLLCIYERMHNSGMTVNKILHRYLIQITRFTIPYNIYSSIHIKNIYWLCLNYHLSFWYLSTRQF